MSDTSSGSKSSSTDLVISVLDQLLPQPTTCTDSKEKNNKNKILLILASQSPRRREILNMMGLRGRYSTIPSPLNETMVQARLKTTTTSSNSNNSSSSLTEMTTDTIDPRDYTRILAEEKAHALAQQLLQPGTWVLETLTGDDKDPGTSSSTLATTIATTTTALVLGSDTIVDLEGVILEKPMDSSEAKQTLARLSGRQHLVHTGVALYCVSPAIISSSSSSSSQDDSQELATTRSIAKVSSFVDTATVTFAELSTNDIEAYVETGEPMDKAGSYGIQGIGGQLVKGIEGDFFTVRFCFFWSVRLPRGCVS